MSRSLLAILLLSLVWISAWSVVLPSENRTVEAVSFLPSALQELKEQGVYVLFDEQGHPYGFVKDGVFTDAIKYGALTVRPYSGQGGEVVGSSSMAEAAKEIARLRMEQGESVDWELLQQEDFLKYAYYSQRYKSLQDFVQKGLGLDTKQQAIDFLNSLEPSEANEFLSIFDALDNGKVSPSQYKELLDTLDSINQKDLSKYLDQQTLQNVNDFLDQVKKQAAEKALKSILDDFKPEELKTLYKILRKLDYKTVYEIARDYVREMARDGTLDQIEKNLQNARIPESAKSAFADSAKEFVKQHFWDFVPNNLSYYLLGLALIALTLALRGVGG